MKAIKFLYLLPFLLCINCGTVDGANAGNPSVDVAGEGGTSGDVDAGVGGNSRNVNVGGQGGVAGTSNVGGLGGVANGGHAGHCHHVHHWCNPKNHECH
jgi:hypothetical protein